MTTPHPIPTTVESTDGVSVRVHDFGGLASGPLLLICHATGFNAGAYLPFAAALADRFHCVAIDLRGHGSTVLPDGVSLAWQGMGHDVASVIAAVSPDAPIHVFGHSMGGASIVLAELARPGSVRAAYGFEPILFPTPEDTSGPHESPLVAGARRRRDTFESKQAAIDRYGSRPPLGAFHPEALAGYVEYGFGDNADGTVSLLCTPENEARTFEASMCGAFERLGEVSFPFLVAASGDGDAPAEVAPLVAAANPNFELRSYDDLNHFGPLVEPDRIAADVAEFFLT